jgi:hypothetical protein
MDNLELLTVSRTQVTERRKKPKMNKIMSNTDPTNEIGVGGGVTLGAHELEEVHASYIINL